MSKFKKSAIKVLEYQNFIDTIDSNKIVYYWKQTIELCNSWYGVMTKEKLKRMESEPHFFNAFLDYDVINKRVKIERDDQVEISINNIETLSNKIPELITIQKALSELITQLPNDINKAESWLLHSAMNPGLSSDLEATIYFVSKGVKFDFLDCIKENLRIRMNNLVESTPLLKLKDKKVKNRAINRQILIPEATEILYQNDSLPRLLYFRDNEDELIDSTFIRAIDILCLTGFERWVESYIKEIEQAYTYLDKRYLVLYLFQLCRSDFILRSAKKASIEILLHSLSIGQVESERPWKVSWLSQNANDPLFVDYYTGLATVN